MDPPAAGKGTVITVVANSNGTTAGITGGTINGAVIGGSTPAAGTFTTLSSTGNTVLGDAAADTVTVTGTILGASPLTFEGTTSDSYKTTIAITDPTANRTVTIPDRTGTIRVATAIATITASATPTVDLSSASIFIDTPTDNQAQTITATGAATIPGAISSIKFVGSATNTETITFGTGFTSTGTLTVGNAATNVYIVTFVSDGTTWRELARTATQA